MSIRPDPSQFASAQAFLDGRVVLHAGDCLDVLKGMPDCMFDAVVTDPPYALVSIVKRFGKAGAKPVKVKDGADGAYKRASAGFMGKAWDTGERAFAVEFWAEVLRVLKPGGHVAAFSGTRTYHRLAVAIEDSGFEIRDQLAWAYGSGFPKSHDVSKAIDKALGAVRETVRHKPRPATSGTMSGSSDTRRWIEQSRENGFHEAAGDVPVTPEAEAEAWRGWGTALKPAWEPIVLARKPLTGTVADNVLAHGTGALNVDGCRVGDEPTLRSAGVSKSERVAYGKFRADSGSDREVFGSDKGRWPANIVHDGSDEVLAQFPDSDGAAGAVRGNESSETGQNGIYGRFRRVAGPALRKDTGSAARFFYTAKADAHDRAGSGHPTVKPLDLMQWLTRLITPKGGLVLDPFAGSGTTGEAAWREGFSCHLVEREAEYRTDIERRMKLAAAGPATRKAESTKAKAARRGDDVDHGPLFGGAATPPVTGDPSMANLPMKAGAGKAANEK